MKSVRILVKAGLLAGLTGFAAYAYMVWNNNRPAPQPDQAQLVAALERSIKWLETNQIALLSNRKAPTLWYFIQKAGELTGDPRLINLFRHHEERFLVNRFDLWRPLFYPESWIPVRYENIAALPDYNRHFIYALTCDEDLGQEPDISAQNNSHFCDSKPLSPACATHQLMGIRLLQRNECGNEEELQYTVQHLQQRIRRQLTWDPRIVDVYIQRALMLAESGAGSSIKPVWLQNVLDAQRADGGWGGLDPLISLGSRHLVFHPAGIGIRPVNSDFHATAQGVLLLSILTQSTRP
ncbi:MAG: hypothetical protein RQ736_01345 [Thiogranum sp.]|nr:hypothetical protein [Thiogranum sp.]